MITLLSPTLNFLHLTLTLLTPFILIIQFTLILIFTILLLNVQDDLK